MIYWSFAKRNTFLGHKKMKSEKTGMIMLLVWEL